MVEIAFFAGFSVGLLAGVVSIAVAVLLLDRSIARSAPQQQARESKAEPFKPYSGEFHQLHRLGTPRKTRDSA